MAYAMMGGIIVGTVLTLLFLPTLYVAWFCVKEPSISERTSCDGSNDRSTAGTDLMWIKAKAHNYRLISL